MDPEQIFVRIFVPEPKLGYLKIGQPVNIRIDTFPEKSFPGYIKQIAGKGEFLPRNVQTREQREYQVFAIKVGIKNKDGLLKPGMTAEIKFKVNN
ncbi:MAG: HlyD family secretion protein [bacterium]|nr:MAG: HlyD family secretion protein [bacterium]